MPYDDNHFTHDSDGQHLERARILEEGIVTHGPDLGFDPAQTATIGGHRVQFEDALTSANIEYADVDEIYAELRELETNTLTQYRKCHNYVLGEMVFAETGALAFLEGAFDTDEELPAQRHNFIKVVKLALKAYNDMAVKHPEITLDAGLFDELQNLVDLLEAKEEELPPERGDAREATAVKNSIRANGEKIYRWVYRRVLSHWGDDDSRMLELGMVPISLIGTPQGEPEPPAPGELPQLPEAPEGLNVEIWWEPSLMLLISVGPYGEHTGFDLCKAETPMGMMEPPDRPDENLVSNLPLDVEPFGDGEVVPGMKYWYWARARNGEDVGDWTGPFGIDVE